MKPVVLVAEVDIKRPPGDVFDYCSDHRHEPEWNPQMKRSETITDGPISVGTRYATEFVKAPPMVMECTRYDRPRGWSMAGVSKAFRASGDNSIEATLEGSHLVMRMELEAHGLLRLAAPLLRRRMQPMFEKDLLNIRNKLENARPI